MKKLSTFLILVIIQALTNYYIFSFADSIGTSENPNHLLLNFLSALDFFLLLPLGLLSFTPLGIFLEWEYPLMIFINAFFFVGIIFYIYGRFNPPRSYELLSETEKFKIEKRINKLAQKGAFRAYHRQKGKLTREALLNLKVQTVGPWRRTLISLFGVATTTLGVLMYFQQISIWLCILFFVSGIFSFSVGIIGEKKTVEEMLNGLGNGVSESIVNSIIDNIFNHLNL